MLLFALYNIGTFAADFQKWYKVWIHDAQNPQAKWEYCDQFQMTEFNDATSSKPWGTLWGGEQRRAKVNLSHAIGCQTRVS